MGHYSADYEYEAEKQKKQTTKELEAFAKKVKDLKYNLPSKVPVRFKDSLTDLYNWALVNSKE